MKRVIQLIGFIGVCHVTLLLAAKVPPGSGLWFMADKPSPASMYDGGTVSTPDTPDPYTVTDAGGEVFRVTDAGGEDFNVQ